MSIDETQLFRLLVVDDNESIHQDFRSVLLPESEVSDDLADDEAILFGETGPALTKQYVIDSAFQGEEAIARVQMARSEGKPYSLAFVDVRMPPGIDGIETVKGIWGVDPHVQVVLCTAYSDYSWTDIIQTLGETNQLLIMKKPFESIEARQIACALCDKWQLMQHLEDKVHQRTDELREQSAELATRVRKLKCLYRISDIDHQYGESSLEERIQGIVEIIPEAFPENSNTQAEIVLEGHTFSSVSDVPEHCQYIHDIFANGDRVGNLRILQSPNTGLSTRACMMDDEFLIKSIAQQIGNLVETAKAQMEEAKAKEKLEELVGELSHANEDLTRYAHVVAHDLKSPLRGISATADWIGTELQDHLDENGKVYFREMQLRVKRMVRLIDDILHFAKIQKAEQTAVDLAKLNQDLVFLLNPPEHIQLVIPEDLPTVMCDETSLLQVLQNLLGNAIKYMDKDQGVVRLSWQENEACWQFCVEDNGPGIASQYHDCIFGMFQRLEGNNDQDSTGVGLAIVKRIVELHGGRVWVESEQGQGSRFYFTLAKQGEAVAV